MERRLYLETTIFSYLTAYGSRDLICAARQELTRAWWQERSNDFSLFTSQVVADECKQGDPVAAARRSGLLVGLPRLIITPQVTQLTRALLDMHALPGKAVTDALHIALATAHGMDFLLTWNCTHIANAEMMGKIRHVMLVHGYDQPVICTPEELMGEK